MRIAGSLPRLPQRLMVSGETRRSCATSRTVKRSGKLSSDSCFFVFAVSLTAIVIRTISERFASCQATFFPGKNHPTRRQNSAGFGWFLL